VAMRLTDEAKAAGVQLRSRCAAVAIYNPTSEGATVIAEHDEGLLRVRARRVVIAQGRHEGSWLFEGNDVPGVLVSEAAFRLLAHGVLPGERIVLAGMTSPQRWKSAQLGALATALAEAGAQVLGPFELGALLRARGRRGVRACDVRTANGIERVRCDAVVIAPPTSAVFELADQAGIAVVWQDGSFELEAAPSDGATRSPCARAVGRCAGVFSLEAGIAQAIAAARAIAAELGPSSTEAGGG